MTEFKEHAVKRVNTESQSIPETAKDLGLSDQMLSNWIKESAAGKFSARR